ncbi:MAG: FAD-binding oxidoreductase [Rhodospirillaceae bacterium]|jgi:D-hydroxyproline dehydrogenase subunit beta|nr:FAD-binding oxidoreductase [Rhodospirillaceae bacterium]MBT4487073.1 FAD-binding oxidoreductase [Rhodospirillaceae bacterium]MBT5194095.1 FAD-binding oxidoreductase [Rhodospirillaceae bacterium]MBT5896650.1 FAD-binding oxidoreductase [Rhodospirillaceae bacterium]
MSELTFDAVVVGGGIVGCSAAFFLAREGWKVAVVERDSLACGTSSKSFAWINGTSKTADENYHRLNARGLAAYCELAVEFGEEALGLNPSGTLNVVQKSDAANYAATQEQARQLAAYDYPAAWVDIHALRRMEPHMTLPDDAEALFAMADHCLDAPKFVRFMASQVQALGGTVLEDCAAQSLVAQDDGQVTGLETDQGTLKTRHVVVAAGPGTAEVLSMLTGYDAFATRFPLHQVPGLLVRTPNLLPHRRIRHVVYSSISPEIHMLPDFNGGLKIGSDETDGMVTVDSTPDQLHNVASILLDRAKDLLPGFPDRDCLDECTITLGIRPYPKDGHSLAGPLPGAKGLYVIATHSGITLAPALGGLMTELIATGQTPDMLKPFTLDRIEGF